MDEWLVIVALQHSNVVQTQPGEEFYVCKWSRDAESGHPLLLIAGKNAMVRVIDGTTQRLVHVRVANVAAWQTIMCVCAC